MRELVHHELDLFFALLLFGDVDQHVDTTNQFPTFVMQRGRIWRERDHLPVRPLAVRNRTTNGPVFLQGNRHRTFIVRQWRAVLMMQSPRHAPFVFPQFGNPTGHMDRLLIEVGNPALRVRRVHRSRERV